MAEERKVGFIVSAENQTKETFDQIKRDAHGMAQAVSKAGQDANKGLSGIGDSAAPASQKVDRATRSMISSIQRMTARMEAGSSANTKYWETLAQQRGVDPALLRPYLDQLDQVRVKQEQAAAAMGAGTIQFNQYGLSAKQTAAAMRGVPAQITDIVVALQGGQRPMTVMLQQGGQLKDMFGGIVPAAQALGSTVLKMVNPMMLAAGAVVGLYAAYRAGAGESERFNETLIMTGNAAGVTAGSLQIMAARIGEIVGTQRSASAALTELASAGGIAKENFEELAAAAIMWEHATGTAVADTIKQFVELGKDPVQAALKLNEQTNFLTADIYEQIRALVAQGRETAAAALVQKEWAATMTDRAPQITENLNLWGRMWRLMKEDVAELTSMISGIGRATPVEVQIKNLNAEIADLESKLGAGRGFGLSADRARLEEMRQRRLALMAEAEAAHKAAEAERERNEALRASIQFDAYVGDGARQTRDQQRAADMAKERQAYEARLAEQRRMLERGVVTEEEYRKRIERIETAHLTAMKVIRERYTEKSSGGISTTQTELARLNSLIEVEKEREAALHSLEAARATLNEGEKLAIQYGEKLKLVTDAKTRAQLQANKAIAEELGARQRANDAFEKEKKERASAIEQAQRQTLALRDQIATYGMGRSAVEAMTIARLEERLAMADPAVSEATIEGLKREIEARKELLSAMRTKEALDEQMKAWRAWERDVDRIFQQVGQSLTDAIFEGGKSGRDLVKDLFKTLTLRVVINPIMGALQGAVTSGLGSMLGFQNPQGGGPGLLGMAQNVNTLYQATSGGLAANLGQGLSWIGNKLGSETLRAFAMGLTGSAGAPGTVAGITQLGSGFGASLGQTIGTSAAAAFGSSALSLGSGLGLSLGSTIGTSTAAMATTTFSASLGGAGAAAAGGGAASAGAALGAALPFVGGALAIGGLLGGLFGGRTPTTRREQRTQVDYRGGAFDVTSRDGRAPAGSDSAAYQLAQTAVQSANEIFRQVGIDATIDRFHAIMASSYKGDRDGVASGGALRIGGQVLEFGIQDRNNPTLGGFGGWSDAPTLPRLATDIQMSMLQAFQAAGDQLPGVLADMFRGIDIRSLGAEQVEALATSLQTLVTEVNAFQVAVEALPFENLRDLSFDAAGRLLQLAGGLDALLSAQQAYYAAFYSQAEQLELLQSTLTDTFEDLGYALPATTAQYRALVDSLDLTQQSGREAYVTLMQLAPQFAQLVEGAKAVARELATSLMRGLDRDVDIDFDWLAEALADVNTDGFVATMTEVFDRLADRISRVVDSIASEREAVQLARESIIDAAPLTPEQILEQIRGINTLLPSDASAVAAAEALNATSIAAAQAEDRRRALQSQYGSVSGAYNSATDGYGAAQQRMEAAQARVAQLEWDIYAPKTVPYKKLNWHELDAARSAAYGQIDAARAELAAAQAALQAASAALGAAPDLATVQRLQAEYAQSVTAAAAAQAAAAEAAQRAKDEQLAYAESIQRFAAESAQSATKLGRLREETVRYYEAQQALANLMSNSADALRQRAYDFRFGQLDPEDQFKQLQFEFGKAYSMALSTEGETLVGYADTLNRLVNPMLVAAQDMFASDAQYSSFVAQSLARVEAIAGRLDSLAPKDFEDESLEVLLSIDEKLAELEASTRSAEQILASTVAAGSDAVVNGLRQIANALTGKSVAAFAAGGFHAGGLRIVGERGPELELTGPSRIFSAEQTRQILSGGGSGNAELLAEVRALRQEVARLQAATEATASHTARTSRQLDRIEVDGLLVRTESDTPLQVEVLT